VKKVKSSLTSDKLDGPTYSSLTLLLSMLDDKDKSIIVAPARDLTLKTVCGLVISIVHIEPDCGPRQKLD